MNGRPTNDFSLTTCSSSRCFFVRRFFECMCLCYIHFQQTKMGYFFLSLFAPDNLASRVKFNELLFQPGPHRFPTVSIWTVLCHQVTQWRSHYRTLTGLGQVVILKVARLTSAVYSGIRRIHGALPPPTYYPQAGKVHLFHNLHVGPTLHFRDIRCVVWRVFSRWRPKLNPK